MQSYEYNGKKYDFILSMRAKSEIEKAQKNKLKNPTVAKLAMSARGAGGIADLTDEQIVEIIPYMDELGDLAPVEIGFIVLSTYPPYRDEVTREFFNGLVDDMDMKLGVEATYAFFSEVQNEVFTLLAAMQKTQEAAQAIQADRQKFLANK